MFSSWPYRNYHAYLRERFGTRVHKISVDAGFTCPNRDGTVSRGGCTYCNTDSFTPPSGRSRKSIRQQIADGITFVRSRYHAEKFIAYFQPNSNTYAPVSKLAPLYQEALDHPDLIGLAVGTRADCAGEPVLQLLSEIARDYFVAVEYGIESIYDETLAQINRGHNFAQAVDAIQRSQGRGLHLTGHLILGFPNESLEQMLSMAPVVSGLGLHALKIHNLHVVKHTKLASAYQTQPFHLFTYSEWQDLIIRFLERLSPDLLIERLFGETPPHLLIAPDWRMKKSTIIQGIVDEMHARDTYQGRLYAGSKPDEMKDAATVTATTGQARSTV